MQHYIKVIIVILALFCSTTQVLAANDTIPIDFKNACVEQNRMLLEADYNYQIARKQHRTGMLWLGAATLTGGFGIYRAIRIVNSAAILNQPTILSIGPFVTAGIMLVIGSTFFITAPRKLLKKNYERR